MNQKIKTLLSEYGLNHKEINIYTVLVQKKELNAYILAKLTGIHRSTVYSILDRLIEKGFVSRLEKDEKTIYYALEIGQTISRIKAKETLLISLMPELEKLHEKNISSVRVMESKESQKQFNFNLFNQIKQETVKEIYIISSGPTSFIDKTQPEESLSSRLLLKKILKELKKSKQVNIKVIWDYKFRNSETTRIFSGIGQHRFLKLPTRTTTVIFGEYLAYLFTIDGSPQVIEIQNKLIAEENKVYFSYLWKQAKT